ncbi:MAG: tRNA (adenosine(37)-N6)-threonylcarbamoyltransferase complex ATPase subunit type 1 TsaE [Myxococcota bacterium]
MQRYSFDSPDPERTRELGETLGRCIGRDGLILALVGPLGAGKTVFAKGLAEGLGVDPRLVSSPTFVIAQEYPLDALAEGPASGGPTTLHHLDLYRLEAEEELESIGFFDMLAPGNVLAVEWADRFEGVLGRKVLTVELEGPSGSESKAGEGTPLRRAVLSAEGEAAERVLHDFAARMQTAEELGTDSEGGSCGGSGSGEGSGSGDGSGAHAGSGRRARVEMRLLMMLCLCLVGIAAKASEFSGGSREAPRACQMETAAGPAASRGLVTVEQDRLGTLRAMSAACSPASESLTGIGRLVSGGRVEFATASGALLETLPGIGPARAESILAHRAQGQIQSLRDLERVPGIGPKTRARLSRWIEIRNSDLENRRG